MADLRARCRDAGLRVSGRTAELVRSLRNAPVVLLMPANQDAGSRPPATSHAHRNALVVDPQRAWIIATRWACALAACALAVWISTPVATRVVGTLWGLPGLVSLVRFGTDYQKASAARALRDLAWRPDNSEAIAKAGGIPPLVNLLGLNLDWTDDPSRFTSGFRFMKQNDDDDDDDDDVNLDWTDDQLVAAADALRVLARRYDNSRLIHEANGFFPLVALVRDGNDEQKASAAHALGHLLRSACGRAMANLEYKYCYPCHAEAQFVKRAEHDHLPWDDYWGQMEEYAEVTQMVSEAEDTGVKRDRAFPPEWDFRVFMVRHIGEAGGIPPLVALVRDGNDWQKESAAAVLRKLTHACDVECFIKIRIAKAGGIPPLVALVRDGNDEQKESAAGALQLLARRADNQLLIAQAGGIPPLVALVRDGNDEQKHSAAGALRNLAVNVDNEIAIGKAGGIPPLVTLVRDGNDEQKRIAAGALGNLAHSAANKIAIAKAKREAGILTGI